MSQNGLAFTSRVGTEMCSAGKHTNSALWFCMNLSLYMEIAMGIKWQFCNVVHICLF